MAWLLDDAGWVDLLQEGRLLSGGTHLLDIASEDGHVRLNALAFASCPRSMRRCLLLQSKADVNRSGRLIRTDIKTYKRIGVSCVLSLPNPLRFLAAMDYWDEDNGYARGFYLLAFYGNLWEPILCNLGLHVFQ